MGAYDTVKTVSGTPADRNNASLHCVLLARVEMNVVCCMGGHCNILPPQR